MNPLAGQTVSTAVRTLNNGVQIPILGFGTYKLPPAETADAVAAAIEAGYRHIDTAQMYRNEAEVGQGIAASGLPRSEVFVTTKLNNGFHEPEAAMAAFNCSMDALKMDYVDLFLIHWPMPKIGLYPQTWRVLEKIYADGRARAIGVSNFQPHHLAAIADGDVVPAINQIELHPYLTQEGVRAYDAAHGIATEAWSPLGRGIVLDDPIIGAIAASHGVSPAQAIIRWHLQNGIITIPKSSHPDRIAQNADVFNFELTPTEMAQIDALNRNERTGTHPDEENRTDR